MPRDETSLNSLQIARLTRAIAVVTVLALITLGLVWELWLAPTGQRTLAVKVLPLLLVLPGLLLHRMVTYRAISLAVWFYFTEGIVRATTGSGAEVALAWTEVALCLVLFGVCIAHIRGRLGAARVVPADAS